ncbi:E3 ubiquitin protein ligase UPL3-like protein [Tanacetum coccineum]
MGEFNADQQRAFCPFLTGALMLLPDGLAVYYVAYLLYLCCCLAHHSSTNNNAPTNVVGVSEAADDDLPSVMTCANYLKLLAYSTKLSGA